MFNFKWFKKEKEKNNFFYFTSRLKGVEIHRRYGNKIDECYIPYSNILEIGWYNNKIYMRLINGGWRYFDFICESDLLDKYIDLKSYIDNFK